MAAYASLVSLHQVLDTVIHPGGPPIRRCKTQLNSLQDQVVFLLGFLDNPPRKTGYKNMEVQIREAANKVEDHIETLISDRLHAEERASVKYRKFLEISEVYFTTKFFIISIVIGLINEDFLEFVLVLTQYVVHVLNLRPLVFLSLIPISFMNLLLVLVFFLIPWMGRFLVASTVEPIASELQRLVYEAVVKGMSFVETCLTWGYDSNQEDPNLLQVMDAFNSIMKVVTLLDDMNGSPQQGLRTSNDGLSFGSIFDGGIRNNIVVGIENDLEEIKTRLVSNSNKLEVVPIVGMGGIGKTTLATQVYNDKYFAGHFDIRAWVTVSQKYSLCGVLLDLLRSAKISTNGLSEKHEEQLLLRLYQALKGRRYLIVIDDIWDSGTWDSLRKYFPDDGNKSRLLLTTRLSGVARYIDSRGLIHQMCFLDQDQSWKLFCWKVFGEEACSNKLKKIGKEIVENCHGLPLTISVISGFLLKTGKTTKEWEKVAKNLSSVVGKDGDKCMEILSLSYENLPHYLRVCFLYMGMFPEDHEILVSNLTLLWIAEGFLKPNSAKGLELVAEGYLMDLIERNLVIAYKQSANGKVKTCKIHDILRNLCINKAREEKFLYIMKSNEGSPPNSVTTHRGLSIPQDIFLLLERSQEIRNSNIRSLLVFGNQPLPSLEICSGYEFLRVLNIMNILVTYFSDDILLLVNLRYLAVGSLHLPSGSISKLQNLETFVCLNGMVQDFLIVPMEIWMMPKLRHIVASGKVVWSFIIVPRPREDSFVLDNLQTIVGALDFIFSDDVLRRIPNLKRLEAFYNRFSPLECKFEALVNMHSLEKLKLCFVDLGHNSYKLSFPRKLKQLSLSGCKLSWDDMTIVGTLPCLEVLKLRKNAFQGVVWEPREDEFCQLKYLLLERMDVVEWKADEYHFPLLQRLVIRHCYRLKEIPFSIGDIMTLEVIELVSCRPNVVASAERILEDQENIKLFIY